MITKYYTTSEASEILNVSNRAIIKRCVKTNVPKKNSSYRINQIVLNQWIESRSKRTKNKVRNIVPNEVPTIANEKQTFTSRLRTLKEPNVVPMNTDIQKVQQQVQALAQTNMKLLQMIKVMNKQVAELEKRHLKVMPSEKMDKSGHYKKGAEKDEPLNKALQSKLEKQFGYGTKHISINKELPNETDMNRIDFKSTR